MAQNSNQEPPIIFESQVSSAYALHDETRGRASAQIHHAETQRDRIRGILAESGVTLESVSGTPDNLGYEEGRFVVLGKKTGVQEIVDQAQDAAPELSIVQKTPLSETLSSGADLPFVLKRPLIDARGVNKFLINRLEQIEKLKEYADAYSQWMTDRWFTEPYIRTPGNVNSSYRVVVTATGVVIASALLYQPRINGAKAEAPFEERVLKGRFGEPDITDRRRNTDGWEDFADRESKWFLDADAVTSNVSTGGSIVPLKIHGELGTDAQTTREQRKILKAHGIEKQETPADLIDAAIAIGKGVGPKMALLLGIDFLQDEDGKRHLLEINPFPGTDSILTWWGIDPAKSEGNRTKQDRISDDLMRVVGVSLRDMQNEDN